MVGSCHICLMQEEGGSASTLMASYEDRNIDQYAYSGDGHTAPRQRGKSEPASSNRVPDR
jgi:hypothetical protein